MTCCQTFVAYTLLSVLPVTSHFYAGYTAVSVTKSIVQENTIGLNRHTVNFFSISIARDVLAIAAVVTLACLSILTPTVAIAIGGALLFSIALSAYDLGIVVVMKNRWEQGK